VTTRTFGATITQGPQHWAIVQRQQDCGTIVLAGEWSWYRYPASDAFVLRRRDRI